MENIEILTHQALQSIDCKMRDQNKVNWEQRRYEIAKEAMSGILSDKDSVGYASLAAEYSENEKHTYPKAISRYAVACADALIAELKKGNE